MGDLLFKLNNYWLLGLFSLLLFIPGMVNIPVIDRDEAHFAQASKQMLETNNYFQIRFQEKTRFQKPPGINWLQAASVKLLSNPADNEIWPYRIPSLLGALFSILLCYFFSRRFMSDQAAAIGSALLASSLLLVLEAHMAVIDASLLSSVVLMQGALWFIYHAAMNQKKIHWGWAVCFWLAMTYGFVLKGVTPLVGVLSIIYLCIVERQIAWLKQLHIVCGLILFVVLSLAWLYLVNEAEHSNYLLQMINKDLLPKLQGGHESHGKPPLFHLISLPLTFWPASLFLWQGIVYAYRNRYNHVVKFLLAWLLPTWIFFEIMPTKLPQYVLPTFPAIALLCSLAIEELIKTKELPRKGLHILQILWGVLSVALAIAAVIGASYFILNHISCISLLFVLILISIIFIAIYFAWRGLYKQACLSIFTLALAAYSFTFAGLLPQLKPIWLTTNLTSLIDRSQISNEKPLLVIGFEEPSMVFNIGTKLVQFTDISGAEMSLRQDPSRMALVSTPIFAAMINHQLNLAILKRISGYNYSKGQWLALYLVKMN